MHLKVLTVYNVATPESDPCDITKKYFPSFAFTIINITREQILQLEIQMSRNYKKSYILQI